MAIQTLQCPNCLGHIELDDNRETGYCTYCGSAIKIQDYVEKIRIEHVVDDSKKMNNSIALANRAFNAGNYAECYNYCCSALECNVDNAHITLRKGLSAAYMSFSRIGELETAIETATDIISRTSKDPDGDLHSVFTDLLNYIKVTYVMDCERAKGFTYPDLATANNTFLIIVTLSKLCLTCSQLISDDMIAATPSYEEDKKGCLEQGLSLCTLGTSSFKYLQGYERVKKGNSYVQEPVYKKVSSPHINVQKQLQNEFKTAYNNLPSTRSALEKYDEEIDRLQEAIDLYNARFAEYLQANPDIARAYKQNPINFFRRLFKKSKTRKQILSELPAELASLKDIHDLSKTQLRSVRQARATFVKQNTVK